MADSIGTMSLKITGDATGLVSTFRSTNDEIDKQARNVNRAKEEIRSTLNGMQDIFGSMAGSAQRAFSSLKAGDLVGTFTEVAKIADAAQQAHNQFRAFASAAGQASSEARAAFKTPATLQVGINSEGATSGARQAAADVRTITQAVAPLALTADTSAVARGTRQAVDDVRSATREAPVIRMTADPSAVTTATRRAQDDLQTIGRTVPPVTLSADAAPLTRSTQLAVAELRTIPSPPPVALTADASGVARGVQLTRDAMGQVPTATTIALSADTSSVTTAFRRTAEEVGSLTASRTFTLTADATGVVTAARQAREEIRSVTADGPVSLTADVSGIDAATRRATTEVQGLTSAGGVVTIGADASAVTAATQRAAAEVRTIGAGTVTITANADAAVQATRRTADEVRQLETAPHAITLTADASAVTAATTRAREDVRTITAPPLILQADGTQVTASTRRAIEEVRTLPVSVTPAILTADATQLVRTTQLAKAEIRSVAQEAARPVQLNVSANTQGLTGSLQSAAQTVAQTRSPAVTFEPIAGAAQSAIRSTATEVNTSFLSMAGRAGTFADSLVSVAGKALLLKAGIGIAIGALKGAYDILAATAEAARRTSHEMAELGRFSQRIGTDVTGAQALTSVLERAGLDRQGAETTIQRFRDFLGQAARDPGSAAALTLRRIDLQPQQITRLDTTEALTRVVGALNQIQNGYEQAASTQDVFGRSFVDLQQLIQRGPGDITRAISVAERFGDTREMVEVARQTADIERQMRRTSEETWGQAGRDWREFQVNFHLGAALFSNDINDLINSLNLYGRTRSLLTGELDITGNVWRFITSQPAPPPRPTPVPVQAQVQGVEQVRSARDEIDKLIRGGPRVLPVADVNVRLEDQIHSAREMVRFNETLVSQAHELGLVSVNATRAEIDAVRDLVQTYAALQAQGASAQQLAALNSTQQEQSLSREKDRVRGIIETLGLQTDAIRSTRSEAERLGFVQVNATRQELAVAEPLLQLRRQIERTRLAPVALPLFDFLANMQIGARTTEQVRDLTAEWNQQTENVGRSTRQIAIANAEADVAAGKLKQQELDNLRTADRKLSLEEKLNSVRQEGARITQRAAESIRTPLDAFRSALIELQSVMGKGLEVRNLGAAQAFLELERQVTQNLPRSFVVEATDVRSSEAFRQINDAQIRAQVDPRLAGNMQERIQRTLQAANEQRTEQLKELRKIVQEFGRLGVLQPADF